MMYLNREHDIILYNIYCKIRNHEPLTETDTINIKKISWALTVTSVIELDEAQSSIVKDIAGQLYFIDRFLSGE